MMACVPHLVVWWRLITLSWAGSTDSTLGKYLLVKNRHGSDEKLDGCVCVCT